MNTLHFFSLVFSQSLISLDLIEDFLELASREKTEDKDKPLIYKGKLQTFLYYNFCICVAEASTVL